MQMKLIETLKSPSTCTPSQRQQREDKQNILDDDVALCPSSKGQGGEEAQRVTTSFTLSTFIRAYKLSKEKTPSLFFFSFSVLPYVLN